MSLKTKKTLALIIFLIILIGLYFIWRNPLATDKNKVETENLLNADLNTILKVEIIDPSQSIILEKQNDLWVVASEENAPANSVLIDNLLNSIKENKTAAIISSNPDLAINFNLSDATAVKIKITDNQNTLSEIWLGKIGGGSYAQVYAKKSDSNNIVLIDKTVLNSASQPDWKQPQPTPTPEQTSETPIEE